MKGWSECVVPDARVRVIDSPHGAAYRIRVWCPPGASASSPLPAVYVLDGDGFFGTFVEAVRRTSRRRDATNVGPAIIVSIDHADQADHAGRNVLDRRQQDYTPGPAAEEPTAGRPTGGAASFLDLIETGIAPVIERDFLADPARRTLFGHSLAGFFTLHVLTTRPDSFAGYVAVSPSIWWDEPRLRAGLEHLRSRAPRVLIGAGEWEGELPPWQRQRPGAEQVRARRARRAMIERARRFSNDLGRLIGPANVAFHLFPDEDHASVVLVAVARALRFMLGEPYDEAAGPGARRAPASTGASHGTKG